MPPRLLELCPADWLNLLEAFSSQDKVALAYLSLAFSEVSPGSGSHTWWAFRFLQSGALDSRQTEWCFKLNTLTRDPDLIPDFIYRSQSVSFRLTSVRLCVANRRREDFLFVNHFSGPHLTLPLKLSRRLTTTLTSLPSYCVLFSLNAEQRGFVIEKNSTPSTLCTNRHSLHLHGAGRSQTLFS